MKNAEETSRIKLREARHYFSSNHYDSTAFSRCPVCEEKTKIRKYCLVVHIDLKNLFSINKTCRYCTRCDLIIVKQKELDSTLAAICEQDAPDSIDSEYFVFGTMDKKDWKEGLTGELGQREAIERSYPFKDVWDFKVELTAMP